LFDLPYESTWPPQSVEKIASYVKAQTRDTDEVMSGAVIWEFQASRRSFQMISHPLAFQYGMPEGKKVAIERAAMTRPPKVIVVDSYTEKIYIRQVPRLEELLHARYQFVTDAGPASQPVRVYRLAEEPISEEFR